jgi:signal transduction histidine kinase
MSRKSGRIYDESGLDQAGEVAGRPALVVERSPLNGDAPTTLHARDEFIATISHDLKNPLTTIKGQAQILQRRAEQLGEAGEGLMRGLTTIEHMATRMNRMINDLADIAQVRGGIPLELRRQPTDVVALIRQVASEYALTARQHRLHLESPFETLVGHWDPGRLERLIANLVSNAIKFSPDGGEILISVSRDGEDAVLAVRDQGLGIPDEDVPHIFDRLHRGSNVRDRIAGTGMGLAGAHHIVERHGGRIEVESREGEGATFTVRLPLQAPDG